MVVCGDYIEAELEVVSESESKMFRGNFKFKVTNAETILNEVGFALPSSNC